MKLENELTYSGVRASAPTITYPNSDYKEVDLSVFCDFLTKKIKKEQKKRDKITVTIEQNTKQEIYQALQDNFSDDFDLDFRFPSFSSKYFLTDKEILFSITPFFRAYNKEEEIELSHAQKKVDNLKNRHDFDKIKQSDEPMAKQILERYEKAFDELESKKETIKF